MPRGPPIDAGSSLLELRHVRSHVELASGGYELALIIAFVRSYRKTAVFEQAASHLLQHLQGGWPFGSRSSFGHATVRHQSMPIVHQHMAHMAQFCVSIAALLEFACFWVG